MNKTISKVISGFAALAVVMSTAAVTAFAAPATEDSQSTITFEKTSDNTATHTYTYYQLFTGNWEEDENNNVWLNEADFGADIDKEALVDYILKAANGKYVKNLYLTRAINAKVVPASTTSIDDVKAAVTEKEGSAGWLTSIYNPAQFNAENPTVINDILEIFKNIQKDNPNVKDETVHIAGQNYSDDANRSLNISDGDTLIINALKACKKGEGTVITLKGGEEKSISVDNGYYLMFEDDEDVSDPLKRAQADYTRAVAEIDAQLANGTITKDRADALKTLYRNRANALKNEIENKAVTPATIVKIANGTIKVSPKIGVPEVEKKIYENVQAIDRVGGNELFGTYGSLDGDKWNDAADYSIGDTVPFALFGSMPENIKDYSHYFYCFNDRIAKGFETPANIKVVIGETDGSETPDSRKLLNSKDVTQKADVKTVKNDDGSFALTIEFKDVKDLGVEVTKNTIVMVTYDAVLGKDAVIGSKGNTNGVSLEYSLDTLYDGTGRPDTTGTGTGTGTDKEFVTGKTTTDGVTAFTYEVDINKVDSDSLVELSGAIFTLQALDGDHANQFVLVDRDGKVSGWTDEATEDNYMTSDEKGDVKIIGLDDGRYQIIEVKAPEKYHALKAPINITVDATLNNNGTYFYMEDDGRPAYIDFNKGTDVSEAAATVNKDKGIYSIDIGNNKGIILPETGGEGLLAIYSLGSLFAVGGSAYFVKRKKKD